MTTESSATIEKESEFLLTSPPTANAMSVTKRNGTTELVDLNKIVRAVQRCCEGLYAVDPMRVATRTISGLYNGATTRELDELSIRTAALLIGEEPEYGRLAARLLANYIAKEVSGQEIYAFSQSVSRGHEVGLINDRLLNFVQTNARKLNDAISAVLRMDAFQNQIAAEGATVMPMSPDALKSFLASEYAKHGALVARSGAVIE